MEAHDERQSIERSGGSMLLPGIRGGVLSYYNSRAVRIDVLSHGWWVDDVVRVP